MSRSQIRGSSQIIAGTIEDAQISATAGIQTSKLAEGVDFIKRDGSVPFTGNLDLGGNRITNAGASIGASDLVTRAELDAKGEGLKPHGSAKVSSTSTIDLATGGLLTIDGISLSVDDRVLVKDQAITSENGVYVAQVGAWDRALDANDTGELRGGSHVYIDEGSTMAGTAWVVTNSADPIIGTDAVLWTQHSGAGQLDAGDGLVKVGNLLSVQTANGIEVVADSVQVKLDGTTLETSVAGIKFKDVADGSLLIGNAANEATAQVMSGDATMSNDGTLTIASEAIDNAKIANAANISTSKLADGTEFLQRNGSVVWTANQDAGGFRLTNLNSGVAPGDAVTFGQAVSMSTAGQIEIDATQAGAGLAGNGAYTVNAGSNYMKGTDFSTAGFTENLNNADRLLDIKIKDVQDQVSALGAGSITNLQTEINLVETSVGLASDGSFVSPSGTNFIDGTTYVMGSVVALDSQVGTSLGLITANSGLITNIQSELDATQLGAGLNTDGTFSSFTGTNFLDASTSLYTGLSQLDSNIKVGLDAKLDDSQLIDDDTMGTATSSNVASAESVKAYVDGLVGSLEKTEVDDEDLTPQIDGIVSLVSIANTPFLPGKVKLFLNGQRLRKGASNDFTVSGKDITLTFVPEVGDQMWADYYYIA
jgi:hypothetical protein